MDAARVECTGTAGVDAAVLESATNRVGGNGARRRKERASRTERAGTGSGGIRSNAALPKPRVIVDSLAAARIPTFPRNNSCHVSRHVVRLLLREREEERKKSEENARGDACSIGKCCIFWRYQQVETGGSERSAKERGRRDVRAYLRISVELGGAGFRVPCA